MGAGALYGLASTLWRWYHKPIYHTDTDSADFGAFANMVCDSIFSGAVVGPFFPLWVPIMIRRHRLRNEANLIWSNGFATFGQSGDDEVLPVCPQKKEGCVC
jgi:hypothetical protein